MADGHGKVWTFGPNDATLRRRGDKVVIESAAAGLSPADIKAVRGAAATLMPLVGYRGVATVAFVHVPGGGPPRFLEVYPRLSPDHAVIEETTGVDLVRLQLHVGLGGRLEGEPPEPRGVAIQARLNAEDPERGFAPAPGRVARLRLGAGPGIRVDAAVGEDDVIAPGGPMLVAQTLAWGPSRDEARVRLRRAIDETTVVIDGGSTNKGFLLDVLDRPEVRDADVDNAFIDRLAAKGEIAVERDADVALLVAAIDAYETERGVDQLRFFASAHRGRPRTAPEVGRTVELRHRGQGYRVHVARRGPNTYAVKLDGTEAAISLESLGPYERRLHLGSRTSRIVSAVQGDEHLVEVDGTPHRFRRDDQGVVRSPTPGVVVAVPVGVGDEVAAGDPVAVVESMKMETAVAGAVRRPCAAPSRRSERAGRHRGGIGPARRHRSRPGRRPPRRPPRGAERRTTTDTDVRGRCRRDLARAARPDARLRHRGGATPGRRLPTWPRRGRTLDRDPELADAEDDVLVAFADLRVLYRGVRDEADADVQVRAAQEHLHAYLRSLDVEGEGLPASFLAALRRALRPLRGRRPRTDTGARRGAVLDPPVAAACRCPDPGDRRHPRALARARAAGRQRSTTVVAAPSTP